MTPDYSIAVRAMPGVPLAVCAPEACGAPSDTVVWLVDADGDTISGEIASCAHHVPDIAFTLADEMRERAAGNGAEL